MAKNRPQELLSAETKVFQDRDGRELRCHRLSDGCVFWTGVLTLGLRPGLDLFDALWDAHPEEYHEIRLGGRTVKTPRWQQAYGRDYRYTGRVNRALPVTPLLIPFLAWAQRRIEPQLNGLLLNWYDADRGHYIGPHRDSPSELVRDSPILTISLGSPRTFRLRPWKGVGRVDFAAKDGAVFVMPYSTNLAWTHEVPRIRQQPGRRISITIRAFD